MPRFFGAPLQQEVAKFRESQQQETAPAIPDMPSPYDDDFEQRQAERDQAIRDAASFSAKQEAGLQQQRDYAAQQQQAEQQQTLQREQAFSDRAKKSGISDTEMNTALQTMAAYGGVGAEVAGFLVGDDQGPAITAHLAKNPNEILAIQGMNPMQGAVYIATEIRPKLASSTTTSSAPAPADSLGGGGAPPGDDGPRGATYE